MTWREYETGLEDRLIELHNRVHRRAYRAQPSRRVYIPKADGRQRPLGIAALEDKIVQQAVVTILNQITKRISWGFPMGSDLGAASMHGCAVGRDHAEEGELDSRCRRSGLFRQFVARMAGQVHRAPHRRPKGTAPDPEMVEGRGVRGREVVEDRGRDPARGSGFTAAGQHLPAL